jgi:hypothetical protein
MFFVVVFRKKNNLEEKFLSFIYTAAGPWQF